MIKLRKKLAQSTIESAVLGTLILGAISYMITYVAGSWNAHVKNYEETIRESETEQYIKGPPGTFNRGPCRIGNLIPSNPPICGSGGAPCGSNPLCTTICPVGTRLAQRSCINCAPTECQQNECLPYNGCCTQWRANCTPPGDVTCCGVNANCPDGQAWSWRICGGNTEWGCVTNNNCDFSCQGNQAANATICHFGTPQADDRRLPNNNISHRLQQNCSSPPDTIKCESTCNSGWVYQTGNPPVCIGCEAVYTQRNRICFCGREYSGTGSGVNQANCAHRAWVSASHNNTPAVSWCSPNHIVLTGFCEVTPGPGCEWRYNLPMERTLVTSGSGSSQIQGTRCRITSSISGCGGSNCGGGVYNWLVSRSVCVAKPQACPRPSLACRAIPVEDSQPYGTCGANEFELVSYCSGDCSWPHAKTTICCNGSLIPPAQRPICRAIPSLISSGAPNCSANETKWLEYITGTGDPNLDARITYCCNSGRMPPTGTCTGYSGFRSGFATGYPNDQWPNACPQGSYETIERWCSGDCWGGPQDDAKQQVCCQEQP